VRRKAISRLQRNGGYGATTIEVKVSYVWLISQEISERSYRLPAAVTAPANQNFISTLSSVLKS
jgi:hypothetical protein